MSRAALWLPLLRPGPHCQIQWLIDCNQHCPRQLPAFVNVLTSAVQDRTELKSARPGTALRSCRCTYTSPLKSCPRPHLNIFLNHKLVCARNEKYFNLFVGLFPRQVGADFAQFRGKNNFVPEEKVNLCKNNDGWWCCILPVLEEGQIQKRR